MTKRMDTIRIANAFQRAAADGHYEQCRNIVSNFAHVYRQDTRSVISMISVLLMDPEAFSTEEYKRIKKAIKLVGGKYNVSD